MAQRVEQCGQDVSEIESHIEALEEGLPGLVVEALNTATADALAEHTAPEQAAPARADHEAIAAGVMELIAPKDPRGDP